MIIYQGEDVSLVFEAYTDDTMEKREDLTKFNIDGILYTKPHGRIVTLGDGNELPFSSITNSTLQVDLPREVTKEINPGFLQLELRFKTKANKVKHRIAMAVTVEIKKSLLGQC